MKNLFSIIKKKIRGFYYGSPAEFKGCPCGFKGKNKCECNSIENCNVCIKRDEVWKEELVEKKLKEKRR